MHAQDTVAPEWSPIPIWSNSSGGGVGGGGGNLDQGEGMDLEDL